MQTVPEFIDAYSKAHPNHFKTAANHSFHCNCMDCVTFLWTTGHQNMRKKDPAYQSIIRSQVYLRKLSQAQILTLRDLFNSYL